MNKMRLRDERGRVYYGWYVLIMCALVGTFIYNGIISVSGVFILPVTTELGIPMGAFSFYISILSVANIVTLFFISKKMNKSNIKKIMLITGCLGVLSYVGFSFCKEIWQFYLLSVPMGICFGACTMTPCTILISNWFGPMVRGRAMSFYMAGLSLIGMGIINVLNYVVVNWGWRGGYIFCAAGIAVCIPVMAKLAVWSPADKGIERMGEGEELEKLETAHRGQLPGYTFAEGIRKPAVWAVLISCILLVLASSADLQHGLPTLVMAGYTPTMATFLTSLVSAIMIVSTLIVGFINDKCGIQLSAVLTGVLFVACTLGYAFVADKMWLAYPSIICYSFAIPAVNMISPLIMSHVCGEKELHRFIGYVNIFIAVGGIFGATLVGVMFDLTGGYKVPWLVMSAALAAVTIIRGICTSKKNKFSVRDTEA